MQVQLRGFQIIDVVEQLTTTFTTSYLIDTNY